MKTTIVAIIPGGWPGEMFAPGIYQAHHHEKVNPLEAIRAAAQEYVATPEGQEYLESNVGSDVFNWGDAVVAIPMEILRHHGVWSFEAQDLGDVIVVNHDECITD